MLFTLAGLWACNPPLPEETGFWPDSGADSGGEDTADSGEETGETGPLDADGDGYEGDADCDDADADVFPGAPEVLDGVSNDCDEVVDEVEADPLVYGSGSGFGYTVLAFPDEAGTGQDVAVCAFGSSDVHIFAVADLASGGAAEAVRRLVLDGPTGSDLGVDMFVAAVGSDDALADLVVGAPDYEDDGAVVMIRNTNLYGDVDLTIEDYARTLPGEGGYFGKSVALVDDVLAVGAPGLDAGQTGTVYLYAADTLAHPYTGAFADAGQIQGAFGTGFDVASIEWDGDGVADLVVGNPLAGNSPRAFAGQVALWFDVPQPGDVVAIADADLAVEGTSANLFLGGAVLAVPDLDGDGHEELLIGTATLEDGGERVVALVQSTGGSAYELLATVTGISVDIAVSDALAVGDVDGDGVADIGVGAFGQNDEVLIFDGTRLAGGASWGVEDADAWIDSVTPDDDQFGLGLAFLPTGEGDTHDLLVGAPAAGDGALYLIPSAF